MFRFSSRCVSWWRPFFSACIQIFFNLCMIQSVSDGDFLIGLCWFTLLWLLFAESWLLSVHGLVCVPVGGTTSAAGTRAVCRCGHQSASQGWRTCGASIWWVLITGRVLSIVDSDEQSSHTHTHTHTHTQAHKSTLIHTHTHTELSTLCLPTEQIWHMFTLVRSFSLCG